MGYFLKLFKKNSNAKISKELKSNNIISLETQSLNNLDEFMTKLLSGNHYISKREYLTTLNDYEDTIKYFKVLIDSESIEPYCEKNNISSQDVAKIIGKYENFNEIVNTYNEEFIKEKLISEKGYLDNILKEVDPNISLDENQRRVVLSDEDYSLVIAGAGAGKTTTVAAKVKYLVDKNNINPKEILIISFTNKAVAELQDKINRDLKIDCPIATFHATGNAILRKNSQEKLNIVDASKLYFVLQEYFKTSVLKNERLVNNLILFFSSYIDTPFNEEELSTFLATLSKANYTTFKSDFSEYEKKIIDSYSKRTITIQNEIMKSYQEVEIANFLYLNNIEYEYEPLYKYDITFSRKPYTPDFIIKQGKNLAYIEHFGISEDGKNSRFSDDELAYYKKAINDKIILHRKHGTKLIYTFSKYKDNSPLIGHLKEELIRNGFVLNPRSNREVMEKIIALEENRYIRKLVSLVCRFITNFKTNGYTVDEFDRMYNRTKNVRSRLFLDICHDCYLEYDRYLKQNNAVDFEDMINNSANILREIKEMKYQLDFKYIIVDEYQDISKQRFDMVTALSEVTNAKIIAVGDDWQSIYAFSGSDITLFTKFEEKMGYAKELKIINTYRNSQEIIDIAGDFIQKNKAQITKALVSPKHIKEPIIIYTYDGSRKKNGDDNKSGANYEMAKAVEIALEKIMEYNQKENKPLKSPILLLGRFTFDGDKLEKSGLFEYNKRYNRLRCVKYPMLNITFMTAHSSKGLGYDNVIIINGCNDTYGFPAKIEDDPVLSLVVKEDRSIDYAEERRLFYVAMTRTKNRVFIVAPQQKPSEFLLEIKQNYKNVVLKGNWNETVDNSKNKKNYCPICGYPLQLRYKNSYGLRLYICTNEPELCGFMTNNCSAGKLSILKCDKCRDGYLIVKVGNHNEYFLGCTNYKKDGTGCDNNLSKKKFYELYKLAGDDGENKNGEEISKREGEKTDKCYIKKDELNYDNQVLKAKLDKVIKYKDIDLNEIVYIILSCLLSISNRKYYGINVLIDVLRGAQGKKIIEGCLDKITWYGKLKMISRDDLRVIIEWLISNHYILKTNHSLYPVLHPTHEGINYGKYITSKQLSSLLKELN